MRSASRILDEFFIKGQKMQDLLDQKYDLDDACAILDVEESFVLRWINEGWLRYEKKPSLTIHDPQHPPPVRGRKLDVLEKLAEHIDEHGVSPSLNALASAVKVKPSTVHTHLAHLCRHGLVRRVYVSKRKALYVITQAGRSFLGQTVCPYCRRRWDNVEG